MISISVEEICAATKGTLISDVKMPTFSVNQVSTDTRTINQHDLFIALKGPSFDAHKLLSVAIEKGASALLIEKNSCFIFSEQEKATNTIIEVEDTRIALGLLASFVKQKLKGLKCAAITGSNGKTTCKELLSAILIAHCGSADKVLSTAGNFNNDIGLPLTLFRLESQHQFAVVELGANHIGEIAYTSKLAKPDVAMVNNVMPAHLEGFGSLEGVAKAKAEIWSNLSKTGTAVVNLDANFASQFVKQLQEKQQPILCFSTISENEGSLNPDVFATDITFNTLGQATFTLNYQQTHVLQTIEIHLNLPGKHNVSNALAAATMALALDCSLTDIQQGLNDTKQVAGRVNCSSLSEQLTIIDDTYNANSASVRAGIDLLAQYSGQHLLICGDMGELGEYAEQEHRVVGEYAQLHHIERLFTVGSLSQLATNAYNAASLNKGAEHFQNKEQLKLAVKSYLSNEKNKVVVLIKGSRSAKMEEIVTFIKENFSA